ncbi:MAG: hypothetical protein WDW38_008199 [Sanguina aurantia]
MNTIWEIRGLLLKLAHHQSLLGCVGIAEDVLGRLQGHLVYNIILSRKAEGTVFDLGAILKASIFGLVPELEEELSGRLNWLGMVILDHNDLTEQAISTQLEAPMWSLEAAVACVREFRDLTLSKLPPPFLELVHRKYGGGARPVGNASEEGRVTVDAEDGAGPSKRAKISQEQSAVPPPSLQQQQQQQQQQHQAFGPATVTETASALAPTGRAAEWQPAQALPGMGHSTDTDNNNSNGSGNISRSGVATLNIRTTARARKGNLSANTSSHAAVTGVPDAISGPSTATVPVPDVPAMLGSPAEAAPLAMEVPPFHCTADWPDRSPAGACRCAD